MAMYGRQAFAALLLGLSTLLLPAAAQAAEGFATANVNMRSGPSTRYPAVTVIPVGTPVEIHGCLADIPWCDVSFYSGRGWVAGRYVQASYQSRRVYVEPDFYGALGVPIVTFEVGRYWDRHYRNRDFYRDRNDFYRDRNNDRRDRSYYRRDTDGNRNERDRRIGRDYQEFDRDRRNRNDGIVIEGPRRDRDRERIERRGGDDNNVRPDRDGRRDRDRDVNRGENRQNFDRDNNRDRSERRNRDGNGQREMRPDNRQNQERGRGERNERRLERACFPGQTNCT